jgi:hypothetical protein
MFMAGCSGGNQQQSAATTQLAGNNSQPSGQSSQGGKGSSDGQSSGGQSIEPKQLISKLEAAQLLGEAVKDAVTSEKSEMGLKTCFYIAENTASKSYLEIAIIQAGGGQSGGSSGGSGPSSSPSGGQSSGGQGSSQGGGQGQMSPSTIYEAIKKVMADPNSTEPIRIGDEAFATAPGIAILSKKYCIFISASGADPAAAKQLTKQAGELAMSNLERIQGSGGQ